MEVLTRVEPRRGCGYRKAGPGGVGIYLVGGYGGERCERLPYPIHKCPTCGHGIKRSRSWTWVDPREFFEGPPHCSSKGPGMDQHYHWACPLCSPERVFRPDDATAENGKAVSDGLGLLWIGEKHYPTVADFAEEAARMGVSRRLPSIPKGFVPGKTWVALVHPKAILQGRLGEDAEHVPGIFHVFRPSGVDLVIDDPENVPEKAERLAKRLPEGAARILHVIPEEAMGETADLFEREEAPA